MPEREVFLKLEGDDSKLHKSRGRFFSKNAVVQMLKVVIQSSSN